MKGFVPTPTDTVDFMVDRLFRNNPPRRGARLLDPGCGHGAFIQGVVRWCAHHGAHLPTIVGVDLDPDKIKVARRALSGVAAVTLVKGDFLERELGTFDYIVGNPPYVPIEGLSQEERSRYRCLFETARGRLDLYLLFFERALQVLRRNGRLVFITPEKFAYVESARSLRRLLSTYQVEELNYVAEDTFPGLTTYPTITSIVSRSPTKQTDVRFRNGVRRKVVLPPGGESWLAAINDSPRIAGERTLSDLAVRVSCGVATGADSVFLFQRDQLPVGLSRFARPALAGRELQIGRKLPAPSRVLLTPYDSHGRLMPLSRLGPLSDFLRNADIRNRLESRTCVARKPWYAFHETPPFDEMLRPKLLCKDITREPQFWIEPRGDIVPLHSTYYIVPREPTLLEPLADYLNSKSARDWLRANCHRAANGFLRVQSSVLKMLPIPDGFAQPRRVAA